MSRSLSDIPNKRKWAQPTHGYQDAPNWHRRTHNAETTGCESAAGTSKDLNIDHTYAQQPWPKQSAGLDVLQTENTATQRQSKEWAANKEKLERDANSIASPQQSGPASHRGLQLPTKQTTRSANPVPKSDERVQDDAWRLRPWDMFEPSAPKYPKLDNLGHESQKATKYHTFSTEKQPRRSDPVAWQSAKWQN